MCCIRRGKPLLARNDCHYKRKPRLTDFVHPHTDRWPPPPHERRPRRPQLPPKSAAPAKDNRSTDSYKFDVPLALTRPRQGRGRALAISTALQYPRIVSLWLRRLHRVLFLSSLRH
ncbi:hypothetical protein EVAR_17457_1 [Eumeta japonica]|uniref:Uncharacterized protein n=1 Tax=Eumeta variegata TaxID=151549 RepID=A0A4C1VD99_EUMVA|nr:hypothetical protein EVAR_17457_1 [Eumeta japonica]